MPYKKYIKKGGKLYGPYIYHSKRVDGKVVTEYYGQEKPKYNNIFLIALFLAFIVALFLFVFNKSSQNITGKTIADISANYQEGKPLDGKLRIELQQGELLPASTNISFENNGSKTNYPIKDLISSSEQTYQGNFYVANSSISGSGEGFGILGKKITYPKVYFTLGILSQNQTQITQTEGNQTGNNSNETSVPSNNSTTGTANETLQTPTENQTNQNLTTATNETQTPLTGNIISNFFRLTGGFLGITGNAVLEFERDVQGQVSANESFNYTLQQGERAELTPKSVRTDSKALDDSVVNLKQQESQVVVTTDYSESEQGFGQEYLGTEKKELEIDISKLGIILQPGDLMISLDYNGQNIVSFSTQLQQGDLVFNKTTNLASAASLISSKVNATGNLTLPEESKNVSTNVPSLEAVSLTDTEKQILSNEFGNASVQVTSAKEIGNILVVRYEIGVYWIEDRYNKNMDNQTLQQLMNIDRIKWLKDIAKRISEKNQPENVSSVTELQGANFSF